MYGKVHEGESRSRRDPSFDDGAWTKPPSENSIEVYKEAHSAVAPPCQI